ARRRSAPRSRASSERRSWLGPRGGCPPSREDPLLARGPGSLAAVHALVEGSRHALGMLDQREDQDHAAEEKEPVAVDPEPLVERVRDERLGGDQAREDRAR